MRYLPIFLSVAGLAAQTLHSPDNRIAISFDTENGQLAYSVSFQGKPVIDRSAIGLNLEGARPLGSQVRVVSTQPSTIDETYRRIAGKASTIRNHANALLIHLEETAGLGRKLDIEARAYDDAVAFRYIVPEGNSLRTFRLTKEQTEFRLSKDAITYALVLRNYQTMYESEFLKLPASAFVGQGLGDAIIGLPLLANLPGVAWIAITEADMRDYAAMYLAGGGTNWSEHWFESRLSPSVREPGIAVTGDLPHRSPWRVIQIAEEPASLIESNVVGSLNPPCAIADTSWIHPGKAAWDWWSGSLDKNGKRAFTTENMKWYVDFAAKSGLEYMLVDAGWSARNDITKMNGRVDIPELVRYAAHKNVKIWIWAHWSGIDAQMNEAFPLYEKWGVAGVKIDFMSRDDQQMIGFYYRVAETAARHHLMIDFHGATKPTGMDRTWPNIVGYEGVLGMEHNKGGARDNPDHEVTLPFTRMLAGFMDYTPGGFDNATEAEFVARNEHPMVMGTRAHQLAMYAIYESPFQMVSDYPAAYEDQPAFKFIQDAPATWDETRGIGGIPGEYVAVARRRGNNWFLGSMSNWTPRTVDIPLTFLGAGKYTAEIYEDAEDADRFPKNVRVLKRTVDRTMHLKAAMAPGGGYAVRFVPAGE